MAGNDEDLFDELPDEGLPTSNAAALFADEEDDEPPAAPSPAQPSPTDVRSKLAALAASKRRLEVRERSLGGVLPCCGA